MSKARSIITLMLQAAEDAVTVTLGRCERMSRPGKYVVFLDDDEGNTIIKLFKEGA